MGSNGLTEQHLFLGLVVPNLTYEYKQLAQTIYCISVESSSCNEKNLLSVTLQISSSSIQRDSSSILHETVVWKWNSLNFFLKHDSHNIFHPLEQDIFSTGIRLTISCNVQTRQLWSFLFTLETCKICFWKATNSFNFDSKNWSGFSFENEDVSSPSASATYLVFRLHLLVFLCMTHCSHGSSPSPVHVNPTFK